MKWMIYPLCILLGGAAGFMAGRATEETIVEYKEVKLPTVSGTFTGIEPLAEEYPEMPDLPLLPDTVYRDSLVYITQKVDTAAIIAEYQLKRVYEKTLFDDSLGKLDIRLTNRYNRLEELSYVYTPIREVRTIERVKVWQPFVTGSYSSMRMAGIGAGFFYYGMGFYGKYVTDFNRAGFEGGLLYKF